MTKLEEEIYDAVYDAFKQAKEDGRPHDLEDVATYAAAEVAKKYIEKAWKDRIILFMESENDGFKSDNARMEVWLKENGVL